VDSVDDNFRNNGKRRKDFGCRPVLFCSGIGHDEPAFAGVELVAKQEVTLGT
jgi:hypothetical protein